MDLPLPSESFILNFVPDESYVESVVSNPDYVPYFAENMDSKYNQLSVMYHSTEKLAVLTNPTY